MCQLRVGQSMGLRRNFGLATYGAPLNGGLLQDRIAFVRISLSLVTACLYIAIGTYSCEARLLVHDLVQNHRYIVHTFLRTYVHRLVQAAESFNLSGPKAMF